MRDKKRITHLLSQIYNPEIIPALVTAVSSILDKYRRQITSSGKAELTERDVILITYPDQVRETDRSPLNSLRLFCEQYLTELITGIHLLPFYPWSSDDGFAVIDHRKVAGEYGSWEDVTAVGNNFRLMLDAVINHSSAQSPWFEGFLNDNKDYREFFIEVDGNPDLSAVVRPRNLPLLTQFDSPTGMKAIWTTFGPDQVDLNFHNPHILLEVLDILLYYVKQGAEFIRLDAVAFFWKEIGTGCINLPQTHSVVQLIRAVLDEVAPKVMLITETNVPHDENLSYFGGGNAEAQLIYNFSLPPLVLHAFKTGSARILSKWAAGFNAPSKSTTFLNFLASHDGVGLNPLRGILPEAEIGELAQSMEARGGLISYRGNADGSWSPYEMNINFLDALSVQGEPVELSVKRFICAHAILLAFAGVPAIYFHSLFGSNGWYDGPTKTGLNRSINREKLDRKNIEAQLEDGTSIRAKIFFQLSHLIRVRANHPAFTPYGSQQVLDDTDGIFGILRVNKEEKRGVMCVQNVSNRTIKFKLDITLEPMGQWNNVIDLISGEKYTASKHLLISPYQAMWLTNEN